MAVWGLAVGLGCAISLPLTAWMRSLARRWGQLDYPDERKTHSEAIPVAGGVAVFWATAIPLLVALAVSWSRSIDDASGDDLLALLRLRTPELLVLLAGAFLLHVLGLIDDRYDLSPLPKLVVQVLAILPVVVWFETRLLPEWLGPGFAVVLSVLWFLTVVNAFNFLDGSDGLMGGVAVICALLLGTTALMTHQLLSAALLALLVGALLGFLVFNLPPASIYLGDGGSLVVGYFLAYGSVRITYYDQGFRLDTPWYAVFTPLVVMAIPLYDLVTVLGIRLARFRNPVLPDRQHFLHRLRRRGMSPRRVLVVVCACTLATGMSGVMLIRLQAWQAILVASQTLTILLVLALLESGPADRSPRRGPGEESQ